MKTMRALAVLVAMTSVACSGAPGDDEPTNEEDYTSKTGKTLSHLPDTGTLAMGDCAAQLSGCTLRAKGGNPLTLARRVYDGYFGARRPKTDAEWQWRDATEEELARIEARPPILPLPTGTKPPTKDEYKAWMSLQPDPWRTIEHRKALAKPAYVARAEVPFSRSADVDDARSNLDILASHAADHELPRTDWARAAYYEEQNPFDWQSAGMTHYAVPTSPYSDIMATNFVWRILLAPYQMNQALADCNADPEIPCIESVAALTDVDMYKVYDLQFIRHKPGAPGKYEVSRTVRGVVVDSGHAIDRQSTYGPGGTDKITGATTPEGFATPYLPTYQKTGPRMLWRLELGGQLADQLGSGPGALPGFVRYARSNGTTPADKPEAGSCTDVNEGEWKCQEDAKGAVKTLKCSGFKWQQYTTGCRIPGRPSAKVEPN